VVRVSRALLDEIVAHAREELPNECCGVLATQDDEAVHVYRTENIHRSPLRFEIDPREVLRIHSDLEERGWALGSIYHSHTKSAAYPSQTDLNFAQLWPGVVWLIVSLERDDDPDVRAFNIMNDEISEAELVVV
jgi:proteasome lid subunit RPN8/RPN11